MLALLALAAAAASPSSTCERGLALARRSKCPSSAWKGVLTDGLLNASSSGAPFTYVNAGANKGFAVAEFLQRFHDDGGRTASNREWHRSIKVIKPSGMFGCGMCGACKDPPPPVPSA